MTVLEQLQQEYDQLGEEWTRIAKRRLWLSDEIARLTAEKRFEEHGFHKGQRLHRSPQFDDYAARMLEWGWNIYMYREMMRNFVCEVVGIEEKMLQVVYPGYRPVDIPLHIAKTMREESSNV